MNHIADLLRRRIWVLRPDFQIRRRCYSLNLGVGWAGRFHLFLRKIADDRAFVASGPRAAAHAKRQKPDRPIRLLAGRAGLQVTVEIQFAQLRGIIILENIGDRRVGPQRLRTNVRDRRDRCREITRMLRRRRASIRCDLMIGHREPGIGPAVTGLALNKGAERIRVGTDAELIPGADRGRFILWPGSGRRATRSRTSARYGSCRTRPLEAGAFPWRGPSRPE